MKKIFTIAKPIDLNNVAEWLLSEYCDKPKENLIIALSGDLGAGKTTFVQQLGKLLGVSEHITSPTFSIMKWYDTKHGVLKKLIHIDLYRIESDKELIPLKFTDVLKQPKTVVCVEWPERGQSLLPKETIWIKIENQADEQRLVTCGY
jgi:tRNA threonylcarbamoyladenosine biosynthesis protein TsaE